MLRRRSENAPAERGANISVSGSAMRLKALSGILERSLTVSRSRPRRRAAVSGLSLASSLAKERKSSLRTRMSFCSSLHSR